MDIKTATHGLTQVMTHFLYKINVYMNRSLFVEILPNLEKLSCINSDLLKYQEVGNTARLWC